MATDREGLLIELSTYANAQGWKDADLARALDVSPQVVNAWRSRGEVSKDGVEVVGRKLGLVVTYSTQAAAPPVIREPNGEYSFSIPQYDVRAAMGDGAQNVDYPDVIRMISVDIPQLRRRVDFDSARDLSIITGTGSSMEPTFFDGDLLLMDRSVNCIETDGVFCFVLNGELYVKTLQRSPDGTILMISDNKKYQTYIIKSNDELIICGRIILAWNAKPI